MEVTAKYRPIIDWDADLNRSVVINLGETGEISEKLAEVHRDAWDDGDAAPASAHAPSTNAHPLDRDGDGKAGGSLPKDPPALTNKKRAELFEIAKNEGVTVGATMTNAAIIAAIEEARTANAAADDDNGDVEDLDAPPA